MYPNGPIPTGPGGPSGPGVTRLLWLVALALALAVTGTLAACQSPPPARHVPVVRHR